MLVAESAGAVAIIAAYNVGAAYSVPRDLKKGRQYMDQAFDMTIEWGSLYDPRRSGDRLAEI